VVRLRRQLAFRVRQRKIRAHHSPGRDLICEVACPSDESLGARRIIGFESDQLDPDQLEQERLG
jgi:hypothetical protein